MEKIDNIRLVDFIDYMYDSTDELMNLKSQIDSKTLSDEVMNDASKNLDNSDFNWLFDRNEELKKVSDYIKSIKESEIEEAKQRDAAFAEATKDLPF